MPANTKVHRYTVIKNSDLDNLTDTEQSIFKELLNKIRGGSEGNNYYVVNVDEPYARKVLDVILEGENHKRPTYETMVIETLKKQFPNIEWLDKISWEAKEIKFAFITYPLMNSFDRDVKELLRIVGDSIIEDRLYKGCVLEVECYSDLLAFKDTVVGKIYLEEVE